MKQVVLGVFRSTQTGKESSMPEDLMSIISVLTFHVHDQERPVEVFGNKVPSLLYGIVLRWCSVGFFTHKVHPVMGKCLA